MRKKQDQPKKYTTEAQILKRHHRFIRQSDSESSERDKKSPQRSARKNNKDRYERYGEEMAKKYYSKLFKEYALVDLSRYETGQIGCRWRTQREVVAEKGEKICGSIACDKDANDTFEINFGYVEEGVKKNALVKVSLCPECQKLLNHKKAHRKVHKNSPTKQK